MAAADPLVFDFDPKKTYRRVAFTINNPTFKDAQALWELGGATVTLEGNKADWSTGLNPRVKYLVYGAEHAEGGFDPEDGHPLTPHYQGFLILQQGTKIATIQKLLGGRSHPSQPNKCNEANSRYCKKEGFFFEFGSLKGGASTDKSPAELRKEAIAWLDNEDNKYARLKDIPKHLLFAPGFITAWETLRKTTQGPDRQVKVITVIGPTACGKSYAAHNIFPDHGKWIPGNSGAWFSNGDAPVILFEEFAGQIDLQKMLTLLDHYPLQLEYKGSMCPALFTTVVITSNVTPDHWYGSWLKQAKLVEEARMRGIDEKEAQKKWEESKKALFDRIGFRSNKRGTGFYREWSHAFGDDQPAAQQQECLVMRQEIWDWMEMCAKTDCAGFPDDGQPDAAASAAAASDTCPIMISDEDEAAAAEPPAQMQRMDAEPDLFDWQQRIDSLF